MAKITEMSDKINPIRITLKESGDSYELDFNRDSVRFAEAHSFEVDDVTKFPTTKIPELFYYSMRKNHSVSGDAVDAMAAVRAKLRRVMSALGKEEQDG